MLADDCEREAIFDGGRVLDMVGGLRHEWLGGLLLDMDCDWLWDADIDLLELLCEFRQEPPAAISNSSSVSSIAPAGLSGKAFSSSSLRSPRYSGSFHARIILFSTMKYPSQRLVFNHNCWDTANRQYHFQACILDR